MKKTDFVPPPLPKATENSSVSPITKKKTSKIKWLCFLASFLVILTILTVVIITHKKTNYGKLDLDDSNLQYTQSQDALDDGEIAMYDSNGSMYTAKIDEDYYTRIASEHFEKNSSLTNSKSDSKINRSDNDVYSNNQSTDSTNNPKKNIEPDEYYQDNNGIDGDYDYNYNSESNYTPPNSNTNSYTVSDSKKQKLRIGDSIFLREFEWRIIDIESNKALVIWNGYESTEYNDYLESVTWETCSLRKYLNEDFYKEFSIPERNRILTTDIVNNENTDWGTNGGNKTKDKVFILSADEINKYKDVILNLLTNDQLFWDNKFIWVRTPGKSDNKAAYALISKNHDYSIDYEGVNVNYGNNKNGYSIMPKAVPAMWIKVE